MIYRTYGKAGDRTSALGFGGMRFTNPMDTDGEAAIVYHAFEQGITYFDTAPGYCQDQSEIIMGTAIREMQKGECPFTISTKSMLSDGSKMRRELERSLKRLNVETIDYYHCWCLLTLDDWERRKRGGAVAEMLRARDEGLIRHPVFSTHLHGSDIRKVIEEGWFEGVTLGYSAINSSFRQEGLEAAARHGLGVVVMNPLGGGLIPANESVFGFLRIREEQSIVDAALHYLFSDPRITVTLVGFSSREEIDAAVHAADTFIPYTEEQSAAIQSRYGIEFDTFCTSCKYCNVCPEDIPVWAFMETHNHYRLKEGESIRNRLKFHWSTDMDVLERCTSCRQCEEACTQHLPILQRFEELQSGYRVQEQQRRQAKEDS